MYKKKYSLVKNCNFKYSGRIAKKSTLEIKKKQLFKEILASIDKYLSRKPAKETDRKFIKEVRAFLRAVT